MLQGAITLYFFLQQLQDFALDKRYLELVVFYTIVKLKEAAQEQGLSLAKQYKEQVYRVFFALLNFKELLVVFVASKDRILDQLFLLCAELSLCLDRYLSNLLLDQFSISTKLYSTYNLVGIGNRVLQYLSILKYCLNIFCLLVYLLGGQRRLLCAQLQLQLDVIQCVHKLPSLIKGQLAIAQGLSTLGFFQYYYYSIKLLLLQFNLSNRYVLKLSFLQGFQLSCNYCLEAYCFILALTPSYLYQERYCSYINRRKIRVAKRASQGVVFVISVVAMRLQDLSRFVKGCVPCALYCALEGIMSSSYC